MDEAISYKRISSAKQMKGTGIARQTDMAMEYAKAHGLKLIDTYLDEAVSAYHGANGDRGALKALLDAARAGRFKPGTRLIVDSLDRLTRQEISAAVRLFLDIVDTGLIIVTLIDGEQVFTKERVDNDLTALVIAIVILSRANNESKAKSERVRKARQIAIKKAHEHKIPMGGPHPKWLKLVGEGD